MALGFILTKGKKVAWRRTSSKLGGWLISEFLEGEDILVVFQLLNGNNTLVGESALDMANVEAPKVINTGVDRTIVLERFQYVLCLVSDMCCVSGHHSSSFVQVCPFRYHWPQFHPRPHLPSENTIIGFQSSIVDVRGPNDPQDTFEDLS